MNIAGFSSLISRRKIMMALACATIGPAMTSSCSEQSHYQPQIETFPQNPAQITYFPQERTKDLNPTEIIKIELSDGWFQTISLTNTKTGKKLAGVFNFNRTCYTIVEPLGFNATYAWSGRVVGRDGEISEIAREVSTLKPQKMIHGEFQLADGQVVGIAVPIILQFDSHINDKVAVEDALHVLTDPVVEGSWAWLPDEARGSRVHWRTRHYYPPGTKVHVDANLYGIACGSGAYGDQDLSLDFSIGRPQIVRAVVSSHRMQVIRDGKTIMDFPCSYGQGDQPRNITRNGIHVVTEKYPDFYMTNPPAGYTNIHERWAVRISNNGEFIHANPASAGAQGNSNVTNGCINLSTDNAERYFHSALYGDPVEVSGSPIDLSYEDGDIWDWAVDWDTWLSMSAHSPTPVNPELFHPRSSPSASAPNSSHLMPSSSPMTDSSPLTPSQTLEHPRPLESSLEETSSTLAIPSSEETPASSP